MIFRRVTWLFILAILLSLFVKGCNEVTPPTPVFGEAQLGVVASSPPEDPDGITLSEVRLNLRKVDFRPDSSDNAAVEYQGPFVVNLIEAGEAVNESAPAFLPVSLPVDTYSRVKFRLDPVGDDELPEGLEDDNVVQSLLAGNTIVIEGEFEESVDIDGSGGVSLIPFRFVSDMVANLRIDPTNPFSVEAGETAFIFLAMRLSSWFESVLPDLQDLTAADLTGGTVLLTDNSGSARIQNIVVVIENSIRHGIKFADGVDERFDESDVDENSTSEEDFDD